MIFYVLYVLSHIQSHILPNLTWIFNCVGDGSGTIVILKQDQKSNSKLTRDANQTTKYGLQTYRREGNGLLKRCHALNYTNPEDMVMPSHVAAA